MAATLWLCTPLAAQDLPTTGEDTAAPSERALLDRARIAMEQGQAYYIAGDYPAAAEAFLSAYAVRAFSAFLFNAGVAFERAGDGPAAIREYIRYLDAEPRAADSADVRQRIINLGGTPPPPPAGVEVEVREEPMAAAEEQSMKSLVSVETTPVGAIVTVRRAGRELGSGPAPFTMALNAGQYQVEIQHADYEAVTRPLNVSPGQIYMMIVGMGQGDFLGLLRVVSDPPGARVFIDDRAQGELGSTPFQNPVSAGAHHVWIERPGFQAIERDVEVAAGAEVELSVALERTREGVLRVTGTPRGAEVFVDEERVGTIPYEGALTAGVHQLRVEADGLKVYEEAIEIPRGQALPIAVTLRETPSRGAAWGALITAVLFAGGGTVAGLLGRSLADDLSAERAAGQLTDEDPRILRGKVLYIGADIAFGIAGVLGIMSIIYFLRDPTPDSSAEIGDARDLAFVPSVDLARGSVGGTLRWSF